MLPFAVSLNVLSVSQQWSDKRVLAIECKVVKQDRATGPGRTTLMKLPHKISMLMQGQEPCRGERILIRAPLSHLFGRGSWVVAEVDCSHPCCMRNCHGGSGCPRIGCV